MPQMYENPVRFLQALSSKVKEGWAIIEFDYIRETLVVKNNLDELEKAVVHQGRVEWVALSQQEAEAIRGTDLFFIL